MHTKAIPLTLINR